MSEAPIFVYLKVVREASYTAILVAAALIICSLALTTVRNARERERLRRLERERIGEEYRRLFEKKGHQ